MLPMEGGLCSQWRRACRPTELKFGGSPQRGSCDQPLDESRAPVAIHSELHIELLRGQEHLRPQHERPKHERKRPRARSNEAPSSSSRGAHAAGDPEWPSRDAERGAKRWGTRHDAHAQEPRARFRWSAGFRWSARGSKDGHSPRHSLRHSLRHLVDVDAKQNDQEHRDGDNRQEGPDGAVVHDRGVHDDPNRDEGESTREPDGHIVIQEL